MQDGNIIARNSTYTICGGRVASVTDRASGAQMRGHKAIGALFYCAVRLYDNGALVPTAAPIRVGDVAAFTLLDGSTMTTSRVVALH